MKKFQYLGFVLILLVLYSTGIFAQGGTRLIPFQTTMIEANGNVLPDGLYHFKFKAYIHPNGSTYVWTEEHTASVISGKVNLLLGHISPFPQGLDFTSGLYLGISVDGKPETIPRHLLAPVYHAYSASKADAADHAIRAETATYSPKAQTTDFAPTVMTAENGLVAQTSSEADYAKNASQFGGKSASEYVLDKELTALEERINQISKFYVPVGSVSIYAAEEPPEGYLECKGQELLKSEYHNLYSVIGGIYGETEKTFYVPDYRGYFLRGWNHQNPDASIAPNASSRSISTNIGSRGVAGDRVGTIQAGGVLPHTHTFTTGNNDRTHTHTEYGASPGPYMDEIGAYKRGTGSGTTGASEGHHTHSGTTVNSLEIETRPINVSVMFIIKY